MTWPLLSNGLSEVGQLSAVSARGPHTVDEHRENSCELLNHARGADFSSTESRFLGCSSSRHL